MQSPCDRLILTEPSNKNYRKRPPSSLIQFVTLPSNKRTSYTWHFRIPLSWHSIALACMRGPYCSSILPASTDPASPQAASCMHSKLQASCEPLTTCDCFFQPALSLSSPSSDFAAAPQLDPPSWLISSRSSMSENLPRHSHSSALTSSDHLLPTMCPADGLPELDC